MIKAIIVSTLIACINAAISGGYGGSRSSGSSFGSSYGGSGSGGTKSSFAGLSLESLGLSLGGSSGGGSSSYGGQGIRSGSNVGTVVSGPAAYNQGVINAAVQSTHSVEIKPVSIPQQVIQPQVIEVDAGELPLVIHFKSASSRLQVLQSHQGSGPQEEQHTSSEDEPHRLVHEVTKPVIQEVREIITPFRRVIQEIRPVQEDIQTIVARGDPRATSAVSGGYGAVGGVSPVLIGGGSSLGSGLSSLGYGSSLGSSSGYGGSGGYASSGLGGLSSISSLGSKSSSGVSYSSSSGSSSKSSYASKS